MKTQFSPAVKDADILKHFLDSNDPRSFGLLYERYAPKVFNKCHFMLGEEGLAEDATHDIFVKAFLKLPKFRQEARFSTWLFSIAHNYCIDYLRKKKRQKIHLCDSLEAARNIPEEESDYRQRERKLAGLEEVLKALRPEEKHLLQMKFRDGVPVKAIALAMDKSESAVKMRIKRAKAKVRQLYYQRQGALALN